MRRRVEIRTGLSDEQLVGIGVMTDEHAASSYGLAVFVSDRDGQVYGPGDHPMRRCTVCLLEEPGDEPGWNLEPERWLRVSGWHLAFPLPQ